jgi:glycosyltransferase involved in cell wall biosynthesis
MITSPPVSNPRANTRTVSVIIPASNEGATIAGVVAGVLAQAGPDVALEVIVVDDRSTDATVAEAEGAGATVLRLTGARSGGNPAAARNLGAQAATGDPLIFLDADCTPLDGWLEAILKAHDAGAVIVGGALDLPPGLSWSARCDYYCGWYVIHSKRAAGWVPHHPPPNLSVRRAPFFTTERFTERQPFSYTNEERHWQAALRAQGHQVWFEPKAVAYHWNRPGFANLCRRNYRWAYTAVQAKYETRSARMAWLYRWPWLVVVLSLPLAVAQSAYIVWCWLRAGRVEPIIMLPAILVSRIAYAAGMSVGGARWLLSRGRGGSEVAPKWN